jgi:hypothetical protein
VLFVGLVLASGASAQSIKGHTLGEKGSPNCEELAKRQAPENQREKWIVDCEAGNYTINDRASLMSLPRVNDQMWLRYKEGKLDSLELDFKTGTEQGAVLKELMARFGPPTEAPYDSGNADVKEHDVEWRLPKVSVTLQVWHIKTETIWINLIMSAPGEAPKGVLD